GGSLTMADRTGATACIEFGRDGPLITQGGPDRAVYRTNTLKVALINNMQSGADVVGGTSDARYAYLEKMLPTCKWGISSAKALMATHSENGAPLCQHMERDGA